MDIIIYAKTIRHSIVQGGRFGGFLGVRNSKVSGNYETDGPIGTTFGTRVQIPLGMDIG